MLILIAILISLLIPLLILALGWVRPRPGYQWLLAILGALAVWILVFITRWQLPQSVALLNWIPESLFAASPALLLDAFSWPYAMAIVSLSLAILLTDAARSNELDANAWAASLALSGLGLLSIFAGNPLTLMLTWAIIDLVETWVLLERVSTNPDRERVVIAFSVRVAGLFLLLAADLRASALGQPLTFTAIPAEVGGFLLLASGLRLGVLPPHQPFLKEPPLRRGLGSMVRLLPVMTSLVLLARTATVGAPAAWKPWLIGLAMVAALYSGISWLLAKDELDGRPFWILGMATFALLAAVEILPAASLAWGLAMLYAGSALFLRSLPQRSLLFILVIGLILFSGLPFTPNASGMPLYAAVAWPQAIALGLVQGLLLAGYLRHALRHETADAVERWVWLIYPLGLLIPLLTYLGVSVWDRVALELAWLPAGWWGSLLALSVAGLLAFASRRQISPPERLVNWLQALFSLNWMYAGFWYLYRLLTRLIGIVTRILEGEGGILWALLLLIILVVSLLGQRGGG